MANHYQNLNVSPTASPDEMFSVCTHCNGSGEQSLTGFVTRSNGCEFVQDAPYPCFDCQGTGQCSDRSLQVQRIGQQIKEQRKEMRITMREQAELLGMSVTDLCNLEHGIMDR